MDLFSKERFFGATLTCVVWESAVEFIGQQWQLGPLGNTSQDIPTVQFHRVWIANRNQQQQHYLAETGRLPQHESGGGNREEYQEKFQDVPLSGKRRSAKTQVSQALHSQLYKQAKLSLCHWSSSPYLYPSCLSMRHASACVSVLADITLPISSSLRKTGGHHQKCFVAFLSMEFLQIQLSYAT